MNSILTNSAALAALQSLNMTQAALHTTQEQVSSGLAVSSAADNAAYWSIATSLTSDSGIVSAANSALGQSQAVLSTATTGIQSVITTIDAIQAALTEATNPTNSGNASTIANINTTLASLGKQLTDAITAASFNGTNLLNGSSNSNTGGQVSFVSGFNAATNDVTYVSMTSTALYNTGSATSPTSGTPNTPALGNSALIQKGTTVLAATYDMTTLGTGTGTITSANAEDALTSVDAALTAVTNYAATIGATQTRMTAANTFNSALNTNYTNGVSALVDADMNTASTRLQALQTQQQLGIQSLSIANQNAQLILKLFG